MQNKENIDFWRILEMITNDLDFFKEKLSTSRYCLEEYLEIKYELVAGDVNWLVKCLVKHDPELVNYLGE